MQHEQECQRALLLDEQLSAANLEVIYPGTKSRDEIYGYLVQGINNVQSHNLRFKGAMYERPIDDMYRLFAEGDAVLLTQNDRFAYYGAMIPKFTSPEIDIFGMQLIEFVNSIVPKDLRSNGVGYLGNTVRLCETFRKHGMQSLVYLTTVNGSNIRSLSRTNAACENSGRWHMEPVDFSEFPYFSGLTCIYSARGQDDAHNCAAVRRNHNDSTKKDFQMIIYPNADVKITSIPCTLVVSSIKKAQVFQETCQQLHAQMGENPVYSGDPTVEQILSIGAFFDNIHDTYVR